MVLLVVWRFSCVVRFGLDVESAAFTPVCCTDCLRTKGEVNAVEYSTLTKRVEKCVSGTLGKCRLSPHFSFCVLGYNGRRQRYLGSFLVVDFCVHQIK